MNNKIECGFGVTITPVVENRMGLDYCDYAIKNSEAKEWKPINIKSLITMKK